MNKNKPKRKTVILTLTNQCNLNCSYCYEEHNTTKANYENIIKIIEKEFQKEDEFDEIEFDLFGGEPFLEFEMIKRIINFVETKCWTKPYLFFATTNGTLVHGKIKDWLQKQKNFHCGLSYDGNPAMQDINRTNSSKLIDLDFFKENYPEQEIKMTISEKTINNLYDGIVYLEDYGFNVSCNLAYGIDWSNHNNSIVLEQQLMLLIQRYLKNPHIVPSRLLESNIDDLSRKINKNHIYCGAGTAMAAYDVKGNGYPCQFFMPISCGEEKAKKSKSIKFPKNVIPNELIDEKCRECVIKNVCPTCYGANYVEFGNIFSHSESYCKLTKIITKAKAYLRAEQWKQGHLYLSKDEEIAMLKSITIIQKELKI